MNMLGTFAMLLLALLAAPAVAADLDALVAEALAANPELLATDARREMYERKVVPASALTDPQLTFSFSNYPVDSFSADETPMTGNELRLAQRFPYPGKLGLQGRVAEAQADWYRAVYEDARLMVRHGVKDAYYRLYQQERAISITEKNLRLFDGIIRIAESRYEVGKGLQQDVLKAQVERSRMMDSLFELRKERLVALADLTALLGRHSVPDLSKFPDVDVLPFSYSREDLEAQAAANRPMFGAYRSLVERFASQEKLARLDYKPDFTVFAGYRFRDDGLADEGTDFASAGVTVNLPLYREKRSEALAEAQAGGRMARRQLEDFRVRLAADLSAAYARMERSRDQALLYKTGLVPQASQAFQSAMSAYQVGKVDFLNVLNSLLGLYRFESDYFRAVGEYHRSLARLEAEAGLDVDQIQLRHNPNQQKGMD